MSASLEYSPCGNAKVKGLVVSELLDFMDGLTRVGELVVSGNGRKAELGIERDFITSLVDGFEGDFTGIGFPELESRVRFYCSLFFDEEWVAYVGTYGKEFILKKILECICDPKKISSLQLRVGLGIHDTDVTLVRLPSCIVPVVAFLKKLTHFYEENLHLQRSYPDVVVYSAANSVIRANSLDPGLALKNRDDIFNILRRYSAGMLSVEAANKIQFKNDLCDIPAEVEEVISRVAARLMEESSGFRPVSRIISTAVRHGSEPIVGLSYGVSHAHYSLDPIDDLRSLIADEGTPKKDKEILMIGGKSEVDYWMLRRFIMGERPLTKGGQYIQRYSEYPPYCPSLRMVQQDLSVSDLFRQKTNEEFAISLQEIRSSFRKDIKGVCMDVEDELSFLQELFQVKI